MTKKTILFVSLTLALAATLFGCQGSLTAQQVWDQSFAKMIEITSLNMAGTYDYNSSGATPISGFYERSGKSLLSITQEYGNFLALRIDQDTVYLGFETEGSYVWNQPNTIEDFIYANSGFLFLPLLPPVSDQVKASWISPTLVGEETIDGVDCYHITLLVDPGQYQALAFNGLTAIDLNVMDLAISGTADYWIGKSDLLFHKSTTNIQIEATDNTGASAPLTTEVTLDYSAFNELVTFPVPTP
jgi:hypothetical protein